ncbi:MAG TPA: hypothetical protein VLU46_13340 [Thermoanaerobaculia bacterium]|nr:hypothetical protein [Thermoanaerobaculia bacterium]
MEANEIDILAGAVFRHLEEAGHVVKSAFPRETGGDLTERDGDDRIDLDLAALHPVSLTRPYVRPLPHANGGRDLAGPHAVAEVFDEEHASSLDALSVVVTKDATRLLEDALQLAPEDRAQLVSWASRRRSRFLTAKVRNERDDGASQTHPRADEMHDVDSANARDAPTTEHTEKAHETKSAENEKDPEGCGAITH